MREIKFRAWYENKMIQSSGTVNSYSREKFFSCLDDSAIIMQYTGLKDKNSREIYEGDIVRLNYPEPLVGTAVFRHDEDFVDGEWGMKWMGWVIEDGKKAGKDLMPNANHFSCESNREVIGNIYENPELIEKKE